MKDILQKAIEMFTPWAMTHGIKILAIVVVAYAIQKSGGVFIERATRKIIVPDRFLSREAEKKREDTLIRILSTLLQVLVWVVASLMVIQEFGFAVGPFLAAAGVAGLALGFGGQYLIRDLISGLFIIMENQYRINDVVCFGDTCGTVEDITLRMTTLRDMDGDVHHIPHGEITKVSNLTKDFSRINLNVGVSYDAKLEHVIKVANEVGQNLAQDPEWKDHIIEAPQFLRVDDFADSSVVIKIFGKVAPAQQWAATGELRKRLKIAFDNQGIEIPFPQRVIHQPK